MRILAIESSCDETAAAVVENGRKIISSVVHTQIEEHKTYGGVVPEIASRRHIDEIHRVTKAALAQASMTVEEVDAIGVTAGPGLVGALLVGVNFAKGLAFAANKPLVPVHHLRGHVASCLLTDETLKPPFLCLVASGGNSLIVEVSDYTTFRVLGRSRDDAAGEAFDKAARAMGLPYPGGVHLDRMARLGNDQAHTLPQPKVEGHPLDMSFSGVKTAVVNLIHNAEQKGATLCIEDICASFERTVCQALLSRLTLAAEMTGHTSIAVAGGVSANTRLRSELTTLCNERNWKLCMPPLTLTGDNAAMIGAQAYYEFMAGNIASPELNAVATLSIEKGDAQSFNV